MIRRAPFVGGTLAALVAGSPAPAQSLTTLRVTAVPNDDVTPLLYAQHSGLLRRAGLDVTIDRATSGAAIAAAVVSGTYDVGLISMMALITGHAHGLPFVMIAPSLLYTTDDPASVLLVLRDSPIRSVRDLSGKIISVTAISGVDWVAMHGYAAAAGLDPETLKFVELPMSAIPAAIEQGRIDAGTVANPTMDDALATGKFRSIGKPFDGIAKRWMVAAWSTTATFVAANRDVVNHFASVMRAATAYTNTHRAETAPLIAAFAGIEPAQARAMKRTTCGEDLDPRLIQPAIDAAAKYNIIDRPFAAAELIIRK